MSAFSVGNDVSGNGGAAFLSNIRQYQTGGRREDGIHQPVIQAKTTQLSTLHKPPRERRMPMMKCTYSPVFLCVVLIFLLPPEAIALKSSMTYVPMGENPLLFRAGVEPIMHLDQSTFMDTVFEPRRATAFIVFFYADWCGHCRGFAPTYSSFAVRVQTWREVVHVAAMNCADRMNSQICQANHVNFFPMIKYFPRAALAIDDGMHISPAHSVEELTTELVAKLTNEQRIYSYPDWPNIAYLHVDVSTKFENLWDGGSPTAQYLLIVFEQSAAGQVGAQMLLDLHPFRHQLIVRRALADSPLVSMLHINVFPYVAMFQRGEPQSILMEPCFSVSVTTAQTALNRAMQLHPGQMITLTPSVTVPPPPPPNRPRLIDCVRTPEQCKPLYYASEVDMLKAMHIALLDEVTRANGLIVGDNFTHLHNFVTLVAQSFPTLTFVESGGGGATEENPGKTVNHVANLNAQQQPSAASFVDTNFRRQRLAMRTRRAVVSDDGVPSSSKPLKRSERARLVFAHLKRVLDEKSATNRISSDEWQNQFESIERVYGMPFPINASWEHCRGTLPAFRGYTCGLWTTFHALTVHVYMNSLNESSPKSSTSDAMRPLRTIQGWVKSFFGCEHCKNHFMRMTTELFPMSESRIRHPRDAMMYLWRAHNIVNQRLHGDVTEDPQFTKYQFPPPFLCPGCHAGGHFSRRKVRNFLLQYYSHVRRAPLPKRRQIASSSPL